MPSIQQFKETHNKAEFVLSSAFDINFYLRVEAISKEERQELAQAITEELLKKGNESRLDALITKLSDICFTCKGPEFIRGGPSDFFSDILYSIALQTDKEDFINSCKQVDRSSSQCAFPETYQFNATLARVFSLIKWMANQFATEKNDQNYNENLGQNLANKIFFPLIVNSGDPQDVAQLLENAQLVTPFKVWASAQSAQVKEYFSSRISVDVQHNIDNYFADKKNCHENAISSISNLIRSEEWQLGGFDLFCFDIFKGGVTVDFEGETIRVPHRVADIVELIKEYNRSEDKDVYKLYAEIRTKAQEALDTPRAGQKQSTKDFYQNVLDNLYVAQNVITVDHNEDNSDQIQLI